MGGKLRRFPEYGVTLLIFSGDVAADETAELFKSLDARDRECRLLYFSRDAHVDRVVAEVPQIKRILAEKQRELSGGRHAIVCQSKAVAEYLDFLKRYSAAGDVHATIPRVFPNLKAACDWLGLPDKAQLALAEAAGRESLEAHRPGDVGQALGGAREQPSH